MTTHLPATLRETLAAIVRHDRDYQRRYVLVFHAVDQALSEGIAAGIRLDLELPEWPTVFIDLPEPGGQVSWHMPQFEDPWDGHDTSEKHRRIAAYCATPERAQTSGCDHGPFEYIAGCCAGEREEDQRAAKVNRLAHCEATVRASADPEDGEQCPEWREPGSVFCQGHTWPVAPVRPWGDPAGDDHAAERAAHADNWQEPEDPTWQAPRIEGGE